MNGTAEIEKVLVLSTAHMPKSEPDFGDSVRAEEHAYGYIVFLALPEAPDCTGGWLRYVADWLKPVIRLAWDQGCTYINFDADGGRVDALPQWEW